MRTLVLGVLTLVAIPTFAQNNDLNHGVLEQSQVVSTPNQNFSPLPGGDVIINNYPQQPVVQPVRPKPIYQPSLRRVTSPPVETVKKDSAVVQQMQQSNFLSENGVIWWLIILSFGVVALVFFILGLLLFRNRNRCDSGCGSCRGGNCGNGNYNMNHQRHIDHGFPTTFKHEVKVAVTGIPPEIFMKTEIPQDSSKTEQRPPAPDQSK